tara:strand:- start:17681 stop:18898 length:1218 start_codon:yes stop_codon:yes gene_type:complete
MILKIFINILLYLIISCSLQASEFLIKNAKIHTTSLGFIEGADLHIKEGKIINISKNIIVSGIDKIDAEGNFLTPGFLAPLTQIGLVEIELEPNTRDDSSKYYSSGLGISKAYNPSSSLIPYNLRGGITTSLSSPSFGKNLFSGLISAFSLTSSLEKSLIKRDIGLIARIGGGEDSRAANILMLEDSFLQAKKYILSGKLEEHFKPDKISFSTRDIKSISRVLYREIPLIVHANRASDILALIDLSKEFEINLIIAGAKEGWRVAESLMKAKVPVIIQPIDNLPSSFDEIAASLDNAAKLHEAGVKILISSHETHNAYLSRQGAGIAVSYGLPWHAAIDALSKNIAESFSLNSIGSIEIGKTADFIIWSEDPLEVTAFAERIFISGNEMPVMTRSLRLRDRYLKE